MCFFYYCSAGLNSDYEPARAAEWVFLRSEQKDVVADFSYNHPLTLRSGFATRFRPHDLL